MEFERIVDVEDKKKQTYIRNLIHRKRIGAFSDDLGYVCYNISEFENYKSNRKNGRPASNKYKKV